MKIVAGIATRSGREGSLLKMLKSIRGQIDIIFVHTNGDVELTNEHRNLMDYELTAEKDMADNGKFHAIKMLEQDCYYFSMDDDLYYSPDYVQNMIKAIEKYNCIVSHHGRVLSGVGRNYYGGHRGFKCLTKNIYELELDVCGTGVTAFKTSYFKPHIYNCPDLKMSDLVFSLEAAKQGKRIMLLTHEEGHVKDISPDPGIFGEFRKKDISKQNEYADQIFKIRRGL